MKLFKHDSYEDYKKVQQEVAENGENNVWVSNVELEIMAKHMLSNMPRVSFGICHGVRNGYEVEHLKRYIVDERSKNVTFSTDPSVYFVDIIGTEISDFASKYEDVIQWDFHNVKDEWLEKADFIYSNSIDHSYDPRLALSRWFTCLKPNTGLLYLHHQGANYINDDPTAADCFVATLEEFKDLILETPGTFIKEVIDIPKLYVHPNGRPHMGRALVDKLGRNCGNHNTVHGLSLIVAGIEK